MPVGKPLNTIQVAILLGIGADRVRQLCKRGQLKAIKVGRDWVVEERDALAFAAKERPPFRPRKQSTR